MGFKQIKYIMILFNYMLYIMSIIDLYVRGKNTLGKVKMEAIKWYFLWSGLTSCH
jgi:hypothetical protein